MSIANGTGETFLMTPDAKVKTSAFELRKADYSVRGRANRWTFQRGSSVLQAS